MYRIQIYDSLEDRKLERCWKEVYSRNTYCLQNSYEWARIWWKHFQRKSRRLFVVGIEENNEIIGIGPFIIERNAFFRQLKFIGSGLTDFHAILAIPEKEEEIIDCILDFVLKRKEYSILNLEQIPNNSTLFKICKRAYFFTARELIKCPRIIFDSLSWDQYFHTLGRNSRRDWTKKYNRLTRGGTLEFKKLEKVEEKKEFIKEIFELHVKRWQSRHRASKLSQGNIQRFITEALLKIPEIVIYALFYDNKLISYRLGFAQGPVFYDWNTSYDPEYHSYSVGIILLGLVIRDLIDHSYRELNFMRGDEDYKRKWMIGDQMVINYQFLARAPSLLGYLLAKYYLEWKWWTKRVFRKILEKSLVQKILIKVDY